MVKKKFIDKKSATTFSLVYRSTEDSDDRAERVLVDAQKGVGVGRPDAEVAARAADAAAAAGRRYPPGHPLAWLQEEQASAPMSEERRRELIELGFPDDGYDYLKHTRVLGRGVASLEGMPAAAAIVAAAAAAAAAEAEAAAPGPSFFVPAPEFQAPEEDVQVIDASGLTVMTEAEEEGDAAVMAGGVTAFSRQRERVRAAEKRELAELEAAMAALEEDEDFGDAEGEGDLEDVFVLAATEQGPEASAAAEDEEGGGESDEEFSVVESEEEGEEGSSYGGSGGDAGGSHAPGSRAGKTPARPGSIASTYWREERHDRKNLLTVIDEKFEHLALEYDEEDIGDLEEQGQDIRGFADVAEFDNLLDEFLESHGQSQTHHEGNVPYAAPRISQVGKQMELFGFDDDDADIAIKRAHEALRRAEEEAAAAEAAAAEAGDERRERLPRPVAPERERWDCESVLSLRSNLDNHPGSISEPRYAPRRPRAASAAGGDAGAGAGLIRLDPRTGIPLGVLPRRGAGAAPEQQGAAAADSGSDQDEGEAAAARASGVPERRKGESAEEKKARKAAVKEAKRGAREQKKELKSLYKEATVAAQRRVATAQPQARLKLPGSEEAVEAEAEDADSDNVERTHYWWNDVTAESQWEQHGRSTRKPLHRHS
ncbi:LTV1-like protein isoform A [Micractinium conductrix]|uniref:LTV1-like protein isoform A n=1 Tax=Micractinium conductrix TaxID=554055 RepID=A0A2P6VC30_9CHLO|nr:LTV1-like protein isoform A [Micractinium conductrix]|eukprot:PSC71647.1 LTV1-like protein isoform A [Micractinium conductrix]